MFRALAIIITLLGYAAPAHAAVPVRATDISSSDTALRYIWTYRAKPNVAGIPAAVKAMSQYGLLRDPENSGVYVGFIAGIIGSNPVKADALIVKILPLAPEDQWALIRAIAYSGLPDWRGVLKRAAPRMPQRQAMIDKYLSNGLPTLNDLSLDPPPGVVDKVKVYFKKKAPNKPALEVSPTALDTLWGYYFATGAYAPLSRIVTMLGWSKDDDDIERLTIGNMARYTMASNAARDPVLLKTLKWASTQQQKPVLPVLNEVIEAAETVDLAKIRKEALTSIDEVKRKGPGYKRTGSWWGQLGQGALAAGCIAASAMGAFEFGIPCLVGSIGSSAALWFWNNQ